MNSKILGLLAVGLLAGPIAAQAERLSVHVGADFPLAPLFPAPSTLDLVFSLTEPLNDVVVESPSAFRLSDQAVDIVLDGTANTKRPLLSAYSPPAKCRGSSSPNAIATDTVRNWTSLRTGDLKGTWT